MVTDVPSRVRYADVFGVGGFRVLFTLQTLLVVGDTMRILALSVLVFERTGSAFATAVTFGAGFLPYVAGGTLLLALADRVPARTLMTGFHLLRSGVTGVLAAVDPPVPLVIVLLFGIGLFAPVATASANALLPGLLPGDAYVLGRSLFLMTSAVAQIAGNGVSGLLLAVMRPQGALWLVAGSALAAAALAWFGMADRPARRAGTGAVRETLRTNRMLLADRGTRRLLLAQWLPISLAVGAEGVLVPYAAGLGRPDAAGAVMAAMSGGMFAGHLVVGRFVAPAWRERLALPLALLLGVPLLAFALRPGLVAACALGAVATFGLSYELALQRPFVDRVPEEVRGQALGLAAIGVMSGQGAAMAAAGGLADVLDPGLVMAACGAASVVAALCLVRRSG
ncbi:MFS transporter [Actinomadura kijaniata]|uniref:MFS family permease n=1 Tax=Actinomadura namibiensis TaxID=182080 RepID=A0A7W3LYI9_ACTNM|nr:MFS transporter [Actinomadura namibiensis]MBA8956703.1 MFS family permease [Actinomadura namibiensis]